MTDLKNEIVVFLGKIWIWVVLILIGVFAKFSYDVSIRKKFTFATFCGTLGIAVFVGYLASVYCSYMGWTTSRNFIVPIATLVSEKLIQVIIVYFHKWVRAWFKPPKEDD